MSFGLYLYLEESYFLHLPPLLTTLIGSPLMIGLTKRRRIGSAPIKEAKYLDDKIQEFYN